MKKGNIIGLGIFVAVVNLLIYAGLFAGGIYFIFWCLKHFGIIGGI